MTPHPSLSATLAGLPPPWPDDVLPAIRRELTESPCKVWILDDDPTGTQTIAGLPVLTRWDLATLEAESAQPDVGCFILTNSRALTAAASRRLHEELAHNLRTAAAGRPFSVVSRSDSTLRGHYPLETDILADTLGGADLTLITPYFEAGGRYTLDDVHYVAEGDDLVPAAQTPFARDAVFGYQHSDLTQWVEEKTAGRIPAGTVHRLSLDLIRRRGPFGVAQALTKAPAGSVVIANAVAPSDMEVVVAGVLAAEKTGRRVLARTAAAYVAARVGQRPPPLLEGTAIADPDSSRGGLIVAGSYVPKTTTQLEHLRAAYPVTAIELSVRTLLESDDRTAVLTQLGRELETALAAGHDTLLFTSRDLVREAEAERNLSIGQIVSQALIALVRGLASRPRFLIAKGGITSSDLATEALGVRRSIVRGQILPGVPVWTLGPETRFPGLGYVVFPGNVGGPDALAVAVRKLTTPSAS